MCQSFWYKAHLLYGNTSPLINTRQEIQIKKIATGVMKTNKHSMQQTKIKVQGKQIIF